jgi:hypothetical protein
VKENIVSRRGRCVPNVAKQDGASSICLAGTSTALITAVVAITKDAVNLLLGLVISMISRANVVNMAKSFVDLHVEKTHHASK